MLRASILLLAFLLTARADDAMDALSSSIALGGQEVLAAVRSAPVVQVQRVDSPDPSTYAEGERPPLLELGKPFPVPTGDAVKLRKILMEGRTYLAPPKRCRFRANVRYFFEGSGSPVSVVLCFGCGELEVWRDAKMLAFSPFDSAYGKLLGVTQRLFPDDAFLAEFSPKVFEERVKAMRDSAEQGAPPH